MLFFLFIFFGWGRLLFQPYEGRLHCPKRLRIPLRLEGRPRRWAHRARRATDGHWLALFFFTMTTHRKAPHSAFIFATQSSSLFYLHLEQSFRTVSTKTVPDSSHAKKLKHLGRETKQQLQNVLRKFAFRLVHIYKKIGFKSKTCTSFPMHGVGWRSCWTKRGSRRGRRTGAPSSSSGAPPPSRPALEVHSFGFRIPSGLNTTMPNNSFTKRHWKNIHAHPNTRMKYRLGLAVDRIPVNTFKSGVILFLFSGAIWLVCSLGSANGLCPKSTIVWGGGLYSVPLPRLASELYQLIEPLCAGCIQVSGASGMAIIWESKVWSKQV